MYIETLSGDLLTRISYLDFICSKIGGALVYTRNGLYLGGGQGVNFTELSFAYARLTGGTSAKQVSKALIQEPTGLKMLEMRLACKCYPYLTQCYSI